MDLPEWFTARTRAGAGGCLEWTGCRDRDGYGRVRFAGATDAAHRVAWALVNGPVPAGLCVLHHCDNPPCVNPAHLWVGTKAENNRDAAAKGRLVGPRRDATACIYGHPFTEANTGHQADGRRFCLVCKKARNAHRRRGLAAMAVACAWVAAFYLAERGL